MKIILEGEEFESNEVIGGQDSPYYAPADNKGITLGDVNDMLNPHTTADSSAATPVLPADASVPKAPASTVSSPAVPQNGNASDYSEVADQIFNLVDNDKEKVNAFNMIISAKSTKANEKQNLAAWFNGYVRTNELTDLFDYGQTVTGLIDWIAKNPSYFSKNIDYLAKTPAAGTPDCSKDSSCMDRIKQNIYDEDFKILNGDGSDEDDEDSSIIDDGSEDDGYEDDSSDDDGAADSSVDSSTGGKKRIYKKHELNKVILKMNDDEASEREVYEKYYILTKGELDDYTNLNGLENKLDAKNISYYDFKNCSLKIYDSNEVELNRIFEAQDIPVRCRDIRYYTESQQRHDKEKSAETRKKKKLKKETKKRTKKKKNGTGKKK